MTDKAYIVQYTRDVRQGSSADNTVICVKLCLTEGVEACQVVVIAPGAFFGRIPRALAHLSETRYTVNGTGEYEPHTAHANDDDGGEDDSPHERQPCLAPACIALFAS